MPSNRRHVSNVPQPYSCAAAFSAIASVSPSEQMQFRYIGEFNRVMVTQQQVALDDALDLGTHNLLLLLRQHRNEARRQSAVHNSSRWHGLPEGIVSACQMPEAGII